MKLGNSKMNAIRESKMRKMIGSKKSKKKLQELNKRTRL